VGKILFLWMRLMRKMRCSGVIWILSSRLRCRVLVGREYQNPEGDAVRLVMVDVTFRGSKAHGFAVSCAVLVILQ